MAQRPAGQPDGQQPDLRRRPGFGFALCCLAPTQSLPLAAAAITLTGLGMPLSSVTLSVWAGDLRRAGGL